MDAERDLGGASAGTTPDQEAWLDALFGRVGEGFAVFELVRGPDGAAVDERFVSVSPGVEPSSVGAVGGLAGRLVSELVPFRYPDGLPGHARVAATGTPLRVERHLAGTDRWVAITTYPAGGDRILVTLDDITDLRAAHAALEERERHGSFLVRLLEALRPAGDPEAVQDAAARVLAEHLEADRVFSAEFDVVEGVEYVRVRPGFAREGMAALPLHFRVPTIGTRILEAARSGRLIQAPSLATPSIPPEELARYHALGLNAYVLVPLVKPGRLVAVFVVAQATPRAWTADELALIEETAHRAWSALEWSRAEDALRESERRYGSLFESIDEGYFEGELLRDEAGQPADIRYLDANPAFLREMRRTREELLGHRRSEFYAPDPDSLERIAAAIDGGGAHRYEIYLVSGERWYDATVIPRGGQRFAMLLDDVMERRQAERLLREAVDRQSLLVRLEDALRPLDDPDAVHHEAARLLGEHLRVARCISADFVDGRLRVRGQHVRGVAPAPSEAPMSILGDRTRTAYEAGQSVAVSDVATDPGFTPVERQRLRNHGIAALAGSSILEEGRLIGAMGVHSHVPRAWTPAEVALITEVAQRTWAAAERARAEAALRESEARYRVLFETIEQGFVLAKVLRRPDGSVDVRIVELNPAFDRVTSSVGALVAGRTLRDAVPGVEESWYEVARQVIDERRAIRVEHPIHRGEQWLATVVSPVGEPGDDLIAMVSTDITERRRANDLLAERLEHERVARHEAEAASRLREEFLATVSHELRTPLAAILLWSHLLAGGRAAGHEREAADTIERSAEVLRGLVEDLLDASRMMAGTVALAARVRPLGAVVTEAVETMLPMAMERRVALELRVDHEVPVAVDAPRFAQVVRNLVDNALRYTPEGGRVMLRVRREGDEALLVVADTGRGIRPELLPHVFERFRRGEPRGAGLGLGLAIAREIVGLHGGSIAADSRGDGEGATFTVRLPAAEGEAAEAEAAAPDRAASPGHASRMALEGCRILVAEDDPDTLAALVVLLEGAGAETSVARSGTEALDLLRARGPELDGLLADVLMPGLDGLELVRQLRAIEAREGRPRARAVALSAIVEPGLAQRAIGAGFDACLTKPAGAHDVIRALGGAIDEDDADGVARPGDLSEPKARPPREE